MNTVSYLIARVVLWFGLSGDLQDSSQTHGDSQSAAVEQSTVPELEPSSTRLRRYFF